MKDNRRPDWISQKDFREWCNISDHTEYRWRKQYGLHICKMGDKVFYDRNQIIDIMTANSTYALIGDSTFKGWGK